MAIPIDDTGIAQLLQQEAREADIHKTNVGVLPGVARGSLVAADDLFGLPGIGVDQQLEVSRRLMHVQTQGVKNVARRHRDLAAMGIRRTIVPDTVGRKPWLGRAAAMPTP